MKLDFFDCSYLTPTTRPLLHLIIICGKNMTKSFVNYEHPKNTKSKFSHFPVCSCLESNSWRISYFSEQRIDNQKWANFKNIVIKTPKSELNLKILGVFSQKAKRKQGKMGMFCIMWFVRYNNRNAGKLCHFMPSRKYEKRKHWQNCSLGLNLHRQTSKKLIAALFISKTFQ